jgi:hypothetical protein
MRIWKNRWKILEGIWYNHIVFYFNKKHWAKKLVEDRRKICASCPYLDKEGKEKKTIIKGLPACGLCGCNIKEKTACLSCQCTLGEFETVPRWEAVNIKNDYLIEAKLDG